MFLITKWIPELTSCYALPFSQSRLGRALRTSARARLATTPIFYTTLEVISTHSEVMRNLSIEAEGLSFLAQKTWGRWDLNPGSRGDISCVFPFFLFCCDCLGVSLPFGVCLLLEVSGF